MTELASVLVLNAGVVAAFMLLQWVASLRLRDASIVDRFWGAGFVLVAWSTYALSEGFEPRRLLLLSLVTIWGLRLSLYLTWRNWGEGEDHRYQAMRERHGAAFGRVSLFTVFLLQGAIMWFVALPHQAAIPADSPTAWTWLDAVGAVLWAVGFLMESVADLQLARFKTRPENKGRVLDTGMWRYTRHPNYFGDALLWWGMYLIAAATPAGAWTILSPIAMTFLLMKVSGVPLLERRMKKSRPEYESYVRRTPAFFPWFPKNG